METLIKFRSLADQLNDKEKDEFISKLSSLCDNDLLISAVFDHFSRLIRTLMPYDENKIDDINLAIKTIIHKRDKDQNQSFIANNSSPCIIQSLNEVPSELISNISSFLMRTDYMSFEKTNRYIYVSCNSSCSLQDIEIVQYIGDCDKQLVRYKKYRFVRKLTMFVNDYVEDICLRNPFTFLNLIQLTLYCIDDEHIKLLSTHKCIDFNNITHLACIDIYIKEHIDLFLEFLNRFTHLQYLGMCADAIDFTNVTNLDDKMIIFPDIKGFNLDSGFSAEFRERLYFLHRNKICSLVFPQDTYSDYDFILPNLKELYVNYFTLANLEKIQAMSLNLKMITINRFVHYRENVCSHIDDIMWNLITKQKKLEFIKVYGCHKRLKEILDSTQKALSHFVSNVYQLKLSFIFKSIDMNNIDWGAVMEYTKLIVQSLNSSGVKDFMFAVLFSNNEDNHIQMINLLRQFEDEYLVNYFIDKREYSFTICNKHCKFNGYAGNGYYVH